MLFCFRIKFNFTKFIIKLNAKIKYNLFLKNNLIYFNFINIKSSGIINKFITSNHTFFHCIVKIKLIINMWSMIITSFMNPSIFI